MKIINVFLVIIIFGSLQSCKNEEELLEIACNRIVMEGNWIRNSKFKVYYEAKDSLVENESTSVAIFSEDGSGKFESSATTTYFQWALQCSPDVLMENRISTPLEDTPEEDATDYTAFPTYLYKITKITLKEVQMNTEYYLGANDTRRKINRTAVYSRE